MRGVNSTDIDSMRNLEDFKEKLLKGNWKRKSDSEPGNMKKKVKLSKESQSLEENQRQARSKRKAAGDTLEASPNIVPKCVSEYESGFAASGLAFGCDGGGLCRINTPLLTPPKLSLEEWSTKPTIDSCGLSAVVMHSGMTTGSGHYTASVKVTDLNSLELDKGSCVR
ncbi:hypothetical protein ACRRTK_019741 [Alexandromys fortis]